MKCLYDYLFSHPVKIKIGDDFVQLQQEEFGDFVVPPFCQGISISTFTPGWALYEKTTTIPEQLDTPPEGEYSIEILRIPDSKEISFLRINFLTTPPEKWINSISGWTPIEEKTVGGVEWHDNIGSEPLMITTGLGFSLLYDIEQEFPDEFEYSPNFLDSHGFKSIVEKPYGRILQNTYFKDHPFQMTLLNPNDNIPSYGGFTDSNQMSCLLIAYYRNDPMNEKNFQVIVE